MEYVEELCPLKEDQVEIVSAGIAKLGLDTSTHVLSRAGQKRTPFATRKIVWDFYHTNSTASTNTSRPAKLRVADRPAIQYDLDFVDTTSVVKQRNRNLFESNWYIITVDSKTFKELYHKFVIENPMICVSLGTFYLLKQFYLRCATSKDLEMCVCKTQLHARWAIEALLSCMSKQNIHFEQISNYVTFFQYLYKNCPKGDHSYLCWTCTPDKNTTCQEINSNFDELKNKILAQDDGQTNVKFQYFDKNKNGEVKKRLKQVSTQLWMEEIISFIAERLSKTIHHRNQLKHYRSVIGEFRELYRVSQYKRDPFGG